MNKFYILVFCIFMSACSGSSSNKDSKSIQEIDTSDLEGFWVNSCIISEELDEVYINELISFQSDEFESNANEIVLGTQYFIDSDCSRPAEYIKDLPLRVGSHFNFNPIDIYTNSEGIVAKVIETTTNYDDAVTRFAYYRTNNILYISYEENGEYQFNYEDRYFLYK